MVLASFIIMFFAIGASILLIGEIAVAVTENEYLIPYLCIVIGIALCIVAMLLVLLEIFLVGLKMCCGS